MKTGEVLKGRTALVTGASGGLGADFARELSAKGARLIVVARRADKLEALKAELAGNVDIVALDLEPPDAPQKLYETVKRMGLHVDVLVNNAGFGLYGKFADLAWQRERSMIELDILTLVQMTKLFLPDMIQRGFGRILQVSSIGAFQPTPTYATYSAAKSFVLSFGEALHYELKGTGVSCTVVCPGVTKTEFLAVAGQSPTAYQRRTMMESADVARAGIAALLKGKSSVVPGATNAFLAWTTRFFPRQRLAAISNRLMN